jgi:hypothetical protein
MSFDERQLPSRTSDDTALMSEVPGKYTFRFAQPSVTLSVRNDPMPPPISDTNTIATAAHAAGRPAHRENAEPRFVSWLRSARTGDVRSATVSHAP